MKLEGDVLRDRAREYLRKSAEVKLQVAEECLDSIISAAGMIADVFQAEGKLLLCGNGGSAADCQHMAAELVGSFSKNFARDGLPAIALTTDTSFLTAYTNDWGYEGVFERQVRALGKNGDLLLGISTSGNSPNVMRAVAAARALGIHTIGLSGAAGQLAAVAEISISVPSTETQHIQEAHLTIEHLICELVEQQLFAGTQSPASPDLA
jgi:phosphoheptose isomerase